MLSEAERLLARLLETERSGREYIEGMEALWNEAEVGGVDRGERDLGSDGQASNGEVIVGAVLPDEGSDMLGVLRGSRKHKA